MTVPTRSQKLAQAAYDKIDGRKKEPGFDEYNTVARKFPALVHTCGLAQAVAFSQSKRKPDRTDGGPDCQYVADLAAVLLAGGHADLTSGASLAAHCRSDSVTTYLRLSRDAIDAAVWLKRYAEALSEDAASKQEAKK